MIALVTYVAPEPERPIANDDYVATYRITIALPKRPSVESYGKFFRLAQAPTAAFSELVGAQLGTFIGAPCAETYLALCPFLLSPLNSDWGLPSDRGSLCIASVAVPGIPIRDLDLDSNIRELLACRKLHEAILLDEILFHSGRNNENYAIVGKREFWLYDHEKAMSGPLWTLDLLNVKATQATPGNHLARTFFESGNEVGHRALFNRAKEIETLLLTNDTWHTMVREAARQTDLDKSHADAFIEFIRVRARHLLKFLAWQSQLATQTMDLPMSGFDGSEYG